MGKAAAVAALAYTLCCPKASAYMITLDSEVSGNALGASLVTMTGDEILLSDFWNLYTAGTWAVSSAVTNADGNVDVTYTSSPPGTWVYYEPRVAFSFRILSDSGSTDLGPVDIDVSGFFDTFQSTFNACCSFFGASVSISGPSTSLSINSSDGAVSYPYTLPSNTSYTFSYSAAVYLEP